MKRSEMLIQMQRVYGVRHVMVEFNYLSVKDFCDEMLQHMEAKGMVPPATEVEHADSERSYTIYDWEKE